MEKNQEPKWMQGFDIELSETEKSNLRIEAAGLLAYPISLHRGKLDINKQRREGWIEGAKHQRDEMAILVLNTIKQYEQEYEERNPSQQVASESQPVPEQPKKRTYRDVLMTIPNEQVRWKAINNAGMHIDDEFVPWEGMSDIERAIHGTFTWSNSPEGFQYWREVYESFALPASDHTPETT